MQDSDPEDKRVSDAMLVLADRVFLHNRERIVAFAAKNGVGTIPERTGFAGEIKVERREALQPRRGREPSPASATLRNGAKECVRDGLFSGPLPPARTPFQMFLARSA
jgi:hypothetical protein